jgi:hypothetical protein
MACMRRPISTTVGLALAAVAMVVGGGLGGSTAAVAEVVVLTPAPRPLPAPTPSSTPSPSAAAARSSEPSAAMRASRPVPHAVTPTAVERPRADAAPRRPLITYRVGTRGVTRRGLKRFAAVATSTLNDGRGWGAGALRFQQVRQGAAFRLWLADRQTVAGADPTCSPNYSCRVGRDVFINASRWRHGAQTFKDVPLHSYRQYVINHEVGHWLGLDHRDCARPGGAARVMQQQTISLDGCAPRVWPRAAEQRAVLQIQAAG